MEIRVIEPAEERAAAYLSQQAFGSGHSDISWADSTDREPRVSFGVFDEAGLQAKVAVIPFRIYYGADVVLPMAGVAGVASLPASRGKGYAGKCLKFSLERMREAGQVVSLLYPFSIEYYRRLGWEWAGVVCEYKVPTRVMPASSETELVRAGTDADRDQIIEVYTRFATQHRGMVERSERRWNGMLDHTGSHFRYTYVYERAGSLEGYLTFTGIQREVTQIHEFIALTGRAHCGLLGLLRRHEMQVDAFRWDAPLGDRLWYLLGSGVETRTYPRTMVRVVDVVAALEAVKPGPHVSGEVVMRVSDPAAPWNDGAWHMECGSGTVKVRPTDRQPQLTLDIQALSQAYFGTPALAGIRNAGRVHVSDESGFQTLAAVLDGPEMWTNDFF